MNGGICAYLATALLLAGCGSGDKIKARGVIVDEEILPEEYSFTARIGNSGSLGRFSIKGSDKQVRKLDNDYNPGDLVEITYDVGKIDYAINSGYATIFLRPSQISKK